MTRLTAAGAFACAALVAAPRADAQSMSAPSAAEAREGRTAFEQAYVAFQALDYAAALPLFQRAFQLTRNPAMLYNIGATLEALGRNAEAATAFRRYVAAVPNAPNRAEAERRAARLDAMPANNPAVSSAEPVSTPSSSALPSASSAPPALAVYVPPPRPIWPFVVLGAGIAVGIAGAVTLGLTPDPGATTHANEVDYLRAADAASAQQWAGVALIGVATLAAIGGVVGLVIARPATTPSRAFWHAAPLADGAVLTIGWRGRGL